MKVFFDNNLSVHLAHALHVLLKPEGDVVCHLTDKFRKDVPDIEWMSALGEEGDWVVLSGDISIHRNRAEREAWGRAGLLGFFLGKPWADRKHVEKAAMLLRWWPRSRASSAREAARRIRNPVPVG